MNCDEVGWYDNRPEVPVPELFAGVSHIDPRRNSCLSNKSVGWAIVRVGDPGTVVAKESESGTHFLVRFARGGPVLYQRAARVDA